jgi:hypothetical protein
MPGSEPISVRVRASVSQFAGSPVLGCPARGWLAGLRLCCRRLAAARRLVVVPSESCRHQVEAFSLVVALTVIYADNVTCSEKAQAGDG